MKNGIFEDPIDVQQDFIVNKEYSDQRNVCSSGQMIKELTGDVGPCQEENV